MEKKEKYRQFRKWQHQPHQVAPLSEEMHECSTCGTHFQGNYCPRCGQSARIGRYSFKKAFLLFLDVWGVGNRGMFRSIRDLILRPGYMIRDYLRGMQMAYFPPFKMLFLLCTLSIVVDSGLNIKGVNLFKEEQEEMMRHTKQTLAKQKQTEAQEEKAEEKSDKPLTAEESKRKKKKEEFMRMWNSGDLLNNASQWADKNISLVYLAGLLIFSVPLWLLFRHSPNIPDLHLSECFVAMTYITNMILIYSIILTALWPSNSNMADYIFTVLVLPMIIVPIKQLSGYSYWSTIWRTIAAVIPFVIIYMVLIVVIVLTYAFIYINY